MLDLEATELRSLLSTCIHRYNLQRSKDKWIDAYLYSYQGAANIASTPPGTVRCTGIAIGPYLSLEEKNRRSALSKKDQFPFVQPAPYVFINIHSPDSAIDSAEREQCARCGVQQYVIVDWVKKKVRVYSFDNKYFDIERYSDFEARKTSICDSRIERADYRFKKVFKNDEVVRVRYLYMFKVSASDLLDPSRIPSDLLNSPFQRKEDVEALWTALGRAREALIEALEAALDALNEWSKVRRAKWEARDNFYVAWEAASSATRRGQGKHERRKLKQEAKRLSKDADNLSQEANRLYQKFTTTREKVRETRKERRRACAELAAYNKKIIRNNAKKRAEE